MANKTRPKSRLRSWVQNALGLAILVAVGWALWQRRTQFAELLDASWWDLGAILALMLASWVLSSAQTWLLFRAEGSQIGFVENFVLSKAGNFANYLPMRVGSLVRGRYMKQVHGLRYARFGSVFGIRTVLLLTASGILGTIGTLGLWISEGHASWFLLASFLGMLLITAAAWFFRLPRARQTEARLPRIWNDFLDGFVTARARPRLSALVLGITILSQAVLAMRLYVSFEAFQAQASVWFLILLAPLVVLISFTAITPGALGLREAVFGYVALATGYDFNLGLFAGSLDRAVMLALTLAVGTPSFVYVWRRLDGSPTTSPMGDRSRSGSARP